MEPRHLRRDRGVHARCGGGGGGRARWPLGHRGDAARRIKLEAIDGLRPIAFETITTQAWSQRVAFCLPEAQSVMHRRAALTELGPDAQALRAQDRGAILFDLGLGAAQVDCCIRTLSAELIDGLRGYAGRSLFEAGNPAMGLILRHSPHRVFVTRAGRAEVYQAIPAHGGVSPEGPHTHVLPKLLAHRRTHAATEPIPAGWVSARILYPAHPLRDGYGRAIPFDAARHTRFQNLLRQFGDPGQVQLKDKIAAALPPGKSLPQSLPIGAFRPRRVRIALRQARAVGTPAATFAMACPLRRAAASRGRNRTRGRLTGS